MIDWLQWIDAWAKKVAKHGEGEDNREKRELFPGNFERGTPADSFWEGVF